MRYVDHLEADRVRGARRCRRPQPRRRVLGPLRTQARVRRRHGGLVKTAAVRAERTGRAPRAPVRGGGAGDHRGRRAPPTSSSTTTRCAQGRDAVREGHRGRQHPDHRRRRHTPHPRRRGGTWRWSRWPPSTRARGGAAGRPAPATRSRARCTSPRSPTRRRRSRSSGTEQQLPMPLDIVAAPVPRAGRAAPARDRGDQGEGADLVTVVIGEFVPRGGSTGCTTTARCR